MKRKSYSLNMTLRDEMLNRFFNDVSQQAKESLNKCEYALSNSIYQAIYGDLLDEINQIPSFMFNHYAYLSIVRVIRTGAKIRKKGKITSTKTEVYAFPNFSHGLSLGRPDCIIDSFHLTLEVALPQSPLPSRGCDHLQALVKVGIITEAVKLKVEDMYIEGCKQARVIVDPVGEVVGAVAEILANVKTTSQLLNAWPECEQYVNLPKQELSGRLVKLNMANLSENLAKLYPPAAKSPA